MRSWMAGALLALAVFVVFSNCLPNAFLWDDEQFIVKNVFLTSPRFLPHLFTHNIVAGAGLESNLYRPLPALTHFVDVQLWGYRPWGHHLSTVLIHVAASVAVFRLLATLVPVGPAALGAALFALHPLQAEAVAYTCGRVDGLVILWICLGLLTFRTHPWRSLLCAALAMGSKESGALFPALLMLYDHARQPRAGLRRHLPFWGLSAVYAVARLTVLNFQNTLNFYNQPNLLTTHYAFRVYTYLTTLPKGLLLWLWPVDLHHERAWPIYTSLAIPRVWLSLALLVLLLGLAWWGWRRARRLAVGMWWFVVATLPTSNLLVLINATFYDHWFLLPGVGLALIAAHALALAWTRSAARRRLVTAVSLAVLVALSLATRHYNRLWRDPITLYGHILRWEPGSAKIHNNLAMAYAEAGQLPKAIRLYQRAIELGDEFPQTHHNLARAYLELGDETRALQEFQRAVEIDPRFHHAWIQIGAIRLARARLQDAEAAFEQAIRAYPYAAEAYLGLAQAHAAGGNLHAARAALESGLRHLPHAAALRAALEQSGR